MRWRGGKRDRSAATHLIFYGLAIALPLLLALGALLFQAIHAAQQQLELRIVQVVDDLVDNLDRDLDRQLTILRTLATSPLLRNEDWPRFYFQARASLQGRAYIILTDSSGRQIFNTYVPFGQQPEFTGDHESVRRAVETHQPVISNLFTSQVVEKPVFNISIPVLRDGEARYIMSIGRLPDDVREMLTGLSLGPEWVTTIWDNLGVVLARSRDQERFLGTTEPAGLRLSGGQGTVDRILNLDNEDVLRSTARSKLSGWGVAVDVPASVAGRQMLTGLYLWGGISLIATVLAAWLGSIFGRSLTTPLAAGAAAAIALGRGDVFAIARTRLKEVNSLGQALLDAQRELQYRTAAQRLAEELLRESEQRLRAFLENSAVIAWLKDEEGRYVFISHNYEVKFNVRNEDWVGKTDLELWPKAIAEEYRANDLAVIAGGKHIEVIETAANPDGTYSFWLNSKFPFEDYKGRRYVGGLGVDITERKRAEEQKSLLINELNHRVKNTLATVQSIALQTFKSAELATDAAKAFEARLMALSAAHNVLTRGNWENADLLEIVMRTVAPYGGKDGRCIEVEGPFVRLSPKVALAIAMGLHELCTNAAKHGALSKPDGRVAINWTIENGSAPRLGLCWVERGGPQVEPPKRKGFGSLLVEKLLAEDLGAHIDLIYASEGVICTVDSPLGAEGGIASKA